MAQAALTRPRLWALGRIPPIRPVWLILFGLLLLAVVSWAIWNAFFATRPSRPTFQTAPVTRGALQVSVSATGPISNPTSIPLTFKSSGRLVELNVAVGDRVQAGQALARLDTNDLQAQVA